MKLRRWIALLAMLMCVAAYSVAMADATIRLDEIGLRYTPIEGELVVTRTDMDVQALSALGTNQQTLLNAMERDGQYLISLLPDGRQFSLDVSEKPTAILSDRAAAMTASEEADFLMLIARKGGYGNATWEQDGYALFTSTVGAQTNTTLSYADVSISTLYLNHVYTFRMDLIGREPQQADIDALLLATQRTLRLNACATAEQAAQAQSQTLTLPVAVLPTDTVTLTFTAQDVPLMLDPVASTIGTTNVTLSGTTAPGANVRYSVNGISSSRIKADAQGTFCVTAPNLIDDAENAMILTVSQGNAKTEASFTVKVDWQTSPLALETVGIVESDTVTLKGLALPGTTVQLTKGRGSNHITVDENGAFSVKLLLSRIGDNAFTLQAQANGYRRNTYPFTVVRAEGNGDIINRFQDKARAVDYAKLIAQPTTYRDKVVHLTGTASALTYGNGEPSYVLTTAESNCYHVRCDNLLAITQGNQIELLGTLTGETGTADGYPTLKQAALLP